MKYVFAILLAIHGLIHLMGFTKAFQLADLKQLTLPVSKQAGLFWLLAVVLFLTTLLLFLLKNNYWWSMALIAVLISQAVIILSWKDAKFGSIANLIILLVALISLFLFRFERSFMRDVRENMETNPGSNCGLLTESDIQLLPEPVKNYIRYSGAIDKPKVKNMRVLFEVQMRAKGKEFMNYQSEQYNFLENPARLFFMKGSKAGLPVSGYHRYMNGKANMDIRLMGLIQVVNISGPVLDKTETVTLFNDMCLLAPATLIDKRISWETTDTHSAIAHFTNKGMTISATLHFNDAGQLINFVSDDRTEVNEMKQMPFSTPVSGYRLFNGRNIWTDGEAVWDYPEGKFVYGKFRLKEINYNVK